MFENLNWKEFTGLTIPVHDNAKVIYRTQELVRGYTPNAELTGRGTGD